MGVNALHTYFRFRKVRVMMLSNFVASGRPDAKSREVVLGPYIFRYCRPGCEGTFLSRFSDCLPPYLRGEGAVNGRQARPQNAHGKFSPLEGWNWRARCERAEPKLLILLGWICGYSKSLLGIELVYRGGLTVESEWRKLKNWCQKTGLVGG